MAIDWSKCGAMRVALVEGTPWRVSKDERFLSAPWGEGKLGPKGKTFLSDPEPDPKAFRYEIVEVPTTTWEAYVEAYSATRDLKKDGPRSAGRFDRLRAEIADKLSAEARPIFQKAVDSGYRPVGFFDAE